MLLPDRSAASSEGDLSLRVAPPPDLAAPFVPAVRVVLVASLLALGVLHVLFGAELARWLPAWPDEPPGRPLWSRAAGGALALAAAAALARGRSRIALATTGVVLLVPVLALHLPRSIPSTRIGGEWLNLLKWLALATAPLVAAAQLPPRGKGRIDVVVARMTALAPWAFAAFLVDAAYAHLRYADFVASLIPGFWPWPLFWAYATAAPLCAGGLGLLAGRTRRAAALWTSLMIFLWFLLVHIPRMLANPTGPVGWSEMSEALAFSAFALLLAGPRRRMDRPGA